MIVFGRKSYIILLIRWCHRIRIFFLDRMKHIVLWVESELISHRIIVAFIVFELSI